mgnify:CR=1 FL=1
MVELKPCPFCGGEAVLAFDANDTEITCLPHCRKCDGMIERWFTDADEAAAAWNRRADDG